MASGQITWEFLVPEYYEHRAIWVSGEGHPGFDEDIRPCLEPPCARVFRRRAPGKYSLVRRKEGDHRLGIAECFFKGLTYVRTGVACSPDDLVPFLWLEPDLGANRRAHCWPLCHDRR